MRQLTIRRAPALPGFALPYYCVLNETQSQFLSLLADGSVPEQVFPVGNGETVSVPLDERGGRFFVTVRVEDRCIITDDIVIPAGTEDAKYVLYTRVHPYQGMGVAIATAEAAEYLDSHPADTTGGSL